MRELADILPVSQTGVVINAVNPGLCKTSLARNAPPAFKEQLAQMHASFGRTAEDGSRTLLHGAVGGKESHGSYLDDCEVGEYGHLGVSLLDRITLTGFLLIVVTSFRLGSQKTPRNTRVKSGMV